MRFFSLLLLISGVVLSAQTSPLQADTTAPAPLTPPVTMTEIEEAYAREDFATARDGLAQLAETDDSALVQYRYGRILLDPRSGPVDLLTAKASLERAIAQDHLPSFALLARLYLTGSPNLARNPEQAAQLLSSVAPRGDKEAQYLLALMLREGDGIAPDPVQSFNWLRAAAEQGHVDASFELAGAYALGEGVERDEERALHWLSEAAKDDHVQAQMQLAATYDQGAEGLRNRNRALDWYRRAAQNGHPLAQFVVGTKFLTGDGVYQDTAEAIAWLERSAAANQPAALHNLGSLYADGELVQQDMPRALKYLKAADALGFANSSLLLAQLYETGPLPAQDIPQAIQLYMRADTAGITEATHALGRLAGQGLLQDEIAPHVAVPWAAAAAQDGDAAALAWLKQQAEANIRPAQTAIALHYLAATPPAPETAIPFLKQAAQADDPVAQLQLGELYSSGTGLPQDYVEAHKWVNIAATLGAAGATETRDVLSLLMTAEQIAEAQTAAREHFSQARSAPATD